MDFWSFSNGIELKTTTMKTITTFLLSVIFLPQFVAGQPTLTINEFYNVGDMINMVNVDPTGITVGTPGPGKTWDFSAIDANGSNSVTTVASNTSGVFGTSNLMITLPNGDVEFMAENSANSYINAIYYPATHDTISYNAYDIAVRPVTYEVYYVDSYKVEAGNPLTTGNGLLTIDGDAYGTLVLPNGTFTNVLRIRKYQVETDTIGGVEGAPVITVRYQWFVATNRAPLFEVDSTNTGSSVSVTAMYQADALRVSLLNTATPFSYSGSMQYDDLQLNGTFDIGHKYNVVAYNLTGAKIYTGDFTAWGCSERLDMGHDVIPGLYIVNLTQQDNPSFSQVIKVVRE